MEESEEEKRSDDGAHTETRRIAYASTHQSWAFPVGNNDVINDVFASTTTPAIIKRNAFWVGAAATGRCGLQWNAPLGKSWRGGGKEKGKAQIRTFRPNNWGYGMRDI